MAERWERELQKLKELQPPEGLWDRVESKTPEPGPRFLPRVLTIALAMALGAAGVAGLMVAFLGGREPASLPTNGVFVYADRGPRPPDIPFDNVDLFAFDPATGDRVNLTNTTTVAESSPVWTPDGTRVVYERATARGEGADLAVTYELVAARGDGSDPQVIRNCGPDRCAVSDVVWSPDGSVLAWTGDKRVDSGFVMKLEISDIQTGTTTVVCDSRSCGYPGQPAWAPDGSSVAFSNAGSYRIPGFLLETGPIWLANPTTGEVHPLTTTARSCNPTSEGCVFDSAPEWSPDGTRIAFVRSTRRGQPGATTEVMLVSADGSNERTLSECASQDQCRQGPLAWSPDGSVIAFFERYDETTLTLVDPTTGRMREVSLPSDVGDPYEPHWSPDGSLLAFLGGLARASNLYLVQVSTGDPRQTAEGIARQGGLAWLPEGAIDLSVASSPPVTTPTAEATIPAPAGNVVFASSKGSSQEDEGVEIWTIAPDGSGLARLTRNGFFDGDPAISPEGTQIAFRSYRPGDRNTEIYVMNVDGSEQRVLTDLRTGAGPPDWSPDGERIAFTSGAGYGERGGVFVMNADGSDLELVAEGNAFDPSWSPDGSRIVYALNGPDGKTSLAVVELASGMVTHPAPTLPGDQYEPAWSPDGQLIAFQWFTSSGSGLYSMAPDGSGLRRLAEGSDPEWSPDGRWLAYSHFDDETGPQIWIVAADGTGARSITSMPGFLAGTGISAITGDPSWGPAEG
jgi:TolB protein